MENREMTRLIFVIIFFFLFTNNVWGEIYKWTDENGKMHFTDSENKIPKKYRQKNLNPYNSKQIQFICDLEQYPESENQLNVIQEKIREIQKKINVEENKERRILKRRKNIKTKPVLAGKRMAGDRNRLGRMTALQKKEQDRHAKYDQAAQGGSRESRESGLKSANEPGKRKKSGNRKVINRLENAKKKLEANLDTTYKKFNCEKIKISN